MPLYMITLYENFEKILWLSETLLVQRTTFEVILVVRTTFDRRPDNCEYGSLHLRFLGVVGGGVIIGFFNVYYLPEMVHT